MSTSTRRIAGAPALGHDVQMLVSIPPMDEARRLIQGPFGRALHEAVHQYVHPLWWFDRGRGGAGRIRNGTTFFVNCGGGLFGVTAGHVYDEFAAQAEHGVRCRVGGGPTWDLRPRLISRGEETDIATYRVTSEEVRQLGGIVLTGYQDEWPPKPPENERGSMFAGFPAVERKLLGEHRIEWGIYSALGIASSVSDRDVSCLLERHEWVPTPGAVEPEEGYDLGGMSGAPMLSLVIVRGTLVTWRLAGVLYECSKKLEEIVRAARADVIRIDGTVVGQ